MQYVAQEVLQQAETTVSGDPCRKGALALQVPAMPLNLKRPRLHTSMGTFLTGKAFPAAKASFHTRLARRLPPVSPTMTEIQVVCLIDAPARLWSAVL